MSYTYAQRKRHQGQQNKAPEQTSAPGPEFHALMTGASKPTAAQKGRSIELDAAMKAKMEHAFGDLSAVKLYESRAVGEAGAEAIAQGNEIAFAPGMADFSTRTGQERLGHELSHVMSQRSGRVRGQGFLASASLEARADREGAMAAAGEQVYSGPVTSALSAASPSPAAAGPMQAKRMSEADYRNAWSADKEANMPKYFQASDHLDDAPNDNEKLPWEFTAEELQANPFNPNNNPQLAMQQATIDIGKDPEEAFSYFANMSADSADSKLKNEKNRANNGYWNPYEVDPKLFKAKLKNMARMIHDFPELKGKIGNMKKENALITVMSADSTRGGTEKSDLTYNSSIDSMSWWGRLKNSLFHWGNRKYGVTTQADMSYTPTHELGHTLNSLLLNPNNEDDADDDWDNHKTASSIVEKALEQTMPPEEFNQLKRYKKTNKKKGRIRNQLDLSGSNLYKKGYTSRYGQTTASEFFAEAFADVYSHGADAKPVSIAVVKEYINRRNKMKNRSTYSGLDSITFNDSQDDPLNTSMIAHDDRPKKKKK